MDDMHTQANLMEYDGYPPDVDRDTAYLIVGFNSAMTAISAEHVFKYDDEVYPLQPGTMPQNTITAVWLCTWSPEYPVYKPIVQLGLPQPLTTYTERHYPGVHNLAKAHMRGEL